MKQRRQEILDRYSERGFFNKFLDGLRGATTTNSTFWSHLYQLSEKQPGRVCEVVGSWLDREWRLAQQLQNHEHRISFKGDPYADKPISRAAQLAPEEFVKHVLPKVLSISSWARDAEGDLPRKDRVWRYLSAFEHGQDPHEVALKFLREALMKVSAISPEELTAEVGTLTDLDTHVASTLLLSIFAGNGSYFTNRAVSVFAEQPWRFPTGLGSDTNWFAQKAIAAISRHCSVEHLNELETKILGHVPPLEKHVGGYGRYGQARFNLLAAIPPDLRSSGAQRVFEELERKFHKPEAEPERPRMGWVGPPIQEEKLMKMDDAAILDAIAHFNSGKRPRRFRDFLKGGSPQLSGALARMAEKDPYRFAALALRIPAESDPVYLDELLRVFQKASIDDRLKIEICSKAYREHRDACGREIADVLGAIEIPLPDEAIEQLSWLATKSCDPQTERWKEQSSGGGTYYAGDPYSYGINTTRGRGALAIGQLFSSDVDYVQRFALTLEDLVRDESQSVLACVVFTLRAFAIHDYVRAISLFLQCYRRFPALACGDHGYEIIRAGLRDHFELLRPLLKSMFESTDSELVEAAYRLGCIAALTNEEARVIAEAAASGSDKQRLAAAQVASANLGVEEFRVWCEKYLLRFFNDSNKEVRETAGNCFRQLQSQPLEKFGNVIEEYCRSAAYQDNSDALLYTLETSTDKLPGIVCMACELFLKRFGFEARDFRTARAADGYTVAKLIFRVYHQHQHDEWASRALDVIDQLCQHGVGEVITQLQEFDR